MCKKCRRHHSQTFRRDYLQIDIQGKKVRIGGIAKGSGMIHPNMATLLSVITTDANIDPGLWDSILLHGVQKSFNQVSSGCLRSYKCIEGWCMSTQFPACC